MEDSEIEEAMSLLFLLTIFTAGLLQALEEVGELLQRTHPPGGMERDQEDLHQHQRRRGRGWEEILVSKTTLVKKNQQQTNKRKQTTKKRHFL